ncbi:MAG: tyrosine-type recombinase/integrase [Desulfomonilaceae bacterium]
MSAIKRGKIWYIKFRPFGEQIQLALKDCQSKSQAEKIEDVILESLRKKDYTNLTGAAREALIKLFVNQNWEVPPELKPPTLQEPPRVFSLWDAIKLYTNDPSYKNLSRPEDYATKLAHLVGFFNKDRHVKDIWIPDLKLYRTYRSNQGVSNATINRELAAFSGVFRVLIEHQILDINPCRQLPKLSEKSGQRQVYISYEDIQRIVDVCPDWFQDMIWTAYLTGMRRGEVHKLRWRHVNLNTRIITFHATETKEGQAKRVPIHKDLLPIFDRIGKVRSLSDDRLFKSSQQSLRCPWARALDKLKWEGPRPRFHDLRHTWKTNARRSGIDSEIREMIMGHADRKLDVSERYGIMGDDELVQAIDSFTYDNGLTQILVAAKGQK